MKRDGEQRLGDMEAATRTGADDAVGYRSELRYRRGSERCSCRMSYQDASECWKEAELRGIMKLSK